jgi:AraC-like DNA-binding protein
VRGTGILYANGKIYEISRNFAVYLPSGSRYRFEFKEPSQVKIYVFDFDLTSEHAHIKDSIGTTLEKNFESKKLIKVPNGEEFSSVIINEGSENLQNYIAQAADFFLYKTAHYQHYASAHLKLSLLEIFEEKRLSKGEFRLVEKLQEYIRRNYANPCLTNESIAREFSYHPYYASRVMKECTKKTMHEYLLDYRLHMAKNYLVTSSLNITEIASSCGFASYTYFIKIFREKVGISPLKYRKQYLSVGI